MVQLQYSGMVERFKDVPDTRTRPNRIYPWELLWGLISAAMASACQTPTAIARWITEHRDELLAVLPPTLLRLPCEATIRRTLACVDASKLDAALTLPPPSAQAALIQDAPADRPSTVAGQAIDGKNVRGVTRDGHPCLLVSLVEHGSATVLAQEQVGAIDGEFAGQMLEWDALSDATQDLHRGRPSLNFTSQPT